MTLVATNSAVLHFTGDLDAMAAPAARRAFTDLPHGARVVIDLSDVAFIDSAGLGTLIGGIRMTRERGGDAAICSPRAQICRVLGVTGLNRIVSVVSSVEDGFADILPGDADGEPGLESAL